MPAPDVSRETLSILFSILLIVRFGFYVTPRWINDFSFTHDVGANVIPLYGLPFLVLDHEVFEDHFKAIFRIR
jgi:hypothetical protein